jgi:hypothetical protein
MGVFNGKKMQVRASGFVQCFGDGSEDLNGEATLTYRQGDDQFKDVKVQVLGVLVGTGTAYFWTNLVIFGGTIIPGPLIPTCLGSHMRSVSFFEVGPRSPQMGKLISSKHTTPLALFLTQ